LINNASEVIVVVTADDDTFLGYVTVMTSLHSELMND
jgi:hypothetical protein